MTAQFARASHQGGPAAPVYHPHTALLIDFDNVTMGIRSDLTKELKNLLNSDIIKGKVAVQRAYADWRRYPQYIVPLSEGSVDLIFAPAYGSSKKNATDIRLAIDALELVFTRPEIGTYILLSGDSDFSSLVLKLKEYGKYVIGVGIRESASDLLVQNCDEYYSYSALTGLTRAADEAAAASEDPWELVELAIRQMSENEDVMRSDRLKQVLLELDPNFDEKTLGFPKFNRFLHEAANRGIVKLRKLENGQYEVLSPQAEQRPAGTEEEEEPRDSRRGRGPRRGRGRREGESEGEGRPAVSGSVAHDEKAEPAKGPEPDKREPAAAQEAHREEAARETTRANGRSGDLQTAYDLLRRATADVTKRPGEVARDSDIKRRMLELEAGWDESTFGFSKFSRFLRQAHDAEVINLRKMDNGGYEVALPEDEAGRPAPGRGRRRDQAESRESRPPRRRGGKAAGETAAATPDTAASKEPATPPRQSAAPAQPAEAKEARTTTAQETVPGERAAAARAPATGGISLGFRRGSRGRGLMGEAPPPLLPGQTASPGAAAPGAVAGHEPTEAKAVAEKATPARRGSRGRRGGGRGGKVKVAADAAGSAAAGSGSADLTAALGLPTDADGVIDYLVKNYKGIGRKTGELLVETLGAGRVFNALEAEPDRVKDLLGMRRGTQLVKAWKADLAARRPRRAGGRREPQAATGVSDEAAPEDEAPARPARSRRGGRRGGSRRKTTTKASE